MVNLYSLERFNKQCEYYNALISFVENNCHTKRMDLDYEKYLIIENIIYSFINDVMLGTLYIGKYEEVTDNFEELDQYIDEIESFKNIEVIDKSCNKKHQFRNCLAHADFKFIIDENEESIPYLTADGIYVPKFKNNPLFLEIDNGKIKGRISFSDFWLIMGKYMDIANIEKLSQMVLLPENLKLKTNSQLKNFVDELSVCKINMEENKRINDNSIEEQLKMILQTPIFKNSSPQQIEIFKRNVLNKAKLYGKNAISLTLEKMSEREKELVYNYIKYLGLGTWENVINESQRQELLGDLFALKEGQYCNMYTAMAFSNIFTTLGQNYSNEVLSKKLGHLFMEGPFLYADYVLGYSNYLLGYIRQTKINGNELQLKYKNIDLKGINPNFTDSKESMTKTLMDEEISDEEILKLHIEENLLENTIVNILSKINYMNSQNRDPKKAVRLESIDESLSNINVDDVVNAISKRMIADKCINMTENEIIDTIRHLLNEHEPPNDKEKSVIEMFGKLIKKYKNKNNKEYPIGELSSKWQRINNNIVRYEDSSNLFRHLRNSIEHGRFYIDYNPALIKKDFSKSYIYFYDKDSKESIDNNFTLRITLGRFYKLMEDFSQNIKTQINEQNIDKTEEYKDFLNKVHLYGLSLEELLPNIETLSLECINEKISELIKEKQKELEQNIRPTGEDFETICDEQILLDACNSSIGTELNNDLETEIDINQR